MSRSASASRFRVPPAAYVDPSVPAAWRQDPVYSVLKNLSIQAAQSRRQVVVFVRDAATAMLDSSRHTIIYLPNPAVGARGIYTQIVSALGATPRFYRATLIPQASDLLAAESSERGKTVVLICDEAHLLSLEQFEELRMLTNSEMDSRATFACLLLGQPTLRRKLRQGVFAALDQRIALRCTIDGMDRKETGEYIVHHVKLAGRTDTIFSDDAVALIHDASRGLPRAVNNLATQSLIAAYAQNKSICDESSARAALAEITAE